MKRKIPKEEAVQRITELIINLASEENQDEESLSAYLEGKQLTLQFHITKLVEDILAYCHRKDFPEPLIYTCAELIFHRLKSEWTLEIAGIDAPLSEIKMGDTDFKFAVTSLDLSKIVGEELFNSLKSKLNIYRRLVAL